MNVGLTNKNGQNQSVRIVTIMMGITKGTDGQRKKQLPLVMALPISIKLATPNIIASISTFWLLITTSFAKASLQL